MSLFLERERVKLDILGSLARSQSALASIVEQMSRVTEASPHLARHLLENIRTITGYQEAIAWKLGGLSPGRIRRGAPSAAWLSDDVTPGSSVLLKDGARRLRESRTVPR